MRAGEACRRSHSGGAGLELKELLKIICLSGLYGIAMPCLGVLLRGRLNWQRAAFFLMCLMTVGGFLGPGSWGLTLNSVEYYRGHARGFHFYFNEVLAMSLLLAYALERKPGTRWIPPGLGLYFLWWLSCLVSIVSAPSTSYVLMAAFKSLKMSVFFVAVFHFLRKEQDVRFFLDAMGVVVCWEAVVVLIHKYALGRFQISGTFEHQNSLSMFFGMLGMIYLALALGHDRTGLRKYMLLYLGCAVIVVGSLSRGGLAVFGMGSMGVVALSLLERITPRRLLMVGLLTVLGLLGSIKAMDSLIERFTMPQNIVAGQGRVALKKCSYEMFKDYPFGIGWNNFALVMNRPFPYGAHYDAYTVARGYSVDPRIPNPVVESLYWLLLAETGIQSLVTYVAFIGLMLWWNFRSAVSFRRGFLGSVSVGIALGCGINYVHSYLERVLVFEKNMMLWLMVLGATARIETWRLAVVKLRRQRLAGLGKGGGGPPQGPGSTAGEPAVYR